VPVEVNASPSIVTSANTSDDTCALQQVTRTGAACLALLVTCENVRLVSLQSLLIYCSSSIDSIQYLFYSIVYQRFIRDKIMNFIDLCSLCNISVFILDQHQHGYYIHGRSPFGMADVNIRDMLNNFERESRSLSGSRGLQIDSNEQIFTMTIHRTIRQQYDRLKRIYDVRRVIRR
jgi:hypothetical protein